MRWPLQPWPILLGFLLVSHATDVQAQWLVSAYFGSIHTAPADLAIEQPVRGTALIFPDVPFDGRSFDSPIYYGYRLAARAPRTPWLYVEAELIHGKIFARARDTKPATGRYRGLPASDVPFASVVQAFGVSHGLNFLLVNALLRVPTDDSGRWVVTARVGAGPTIPHPEIEVEGERREGYEIGGLGVQVSAGVERNLWRNLLALADYKFTRADMRLSISDGAARLTVHSHHASFGLGLQF